MNVALFQKEDKTINGALLFKKKKRKDNLLMLYFPKKKTNQSGFTLLK